jgi:hypothetical protein
MAWGCTRSIFAFCLWPLAQSWSLHILTGGRIINVSRNMPDLDLHVLDADGKEVLRDLFVPLFTTLVPGLDARAEELEIAHLHGPPFAVACRYIKGGASFRLSVAAGYHPAISSSRIRIICGMSIMPDVPRQGGKMAIRLGNQTITMKVQVIAEKKREVMLFQPIWNTTAAKALQFAARSGGRA